eukprot:scaffold171817_cov22-Tisochrysis_lutea.AAC.1
MKVTLTSLAHSLDGSSSSKGKQAWPIERRDVPAFYRRSVDIAGSVRITDVPLVPAGALTEAVRAERERQGQATQDYDLHLVQQQQQQQQ